jgi:cyanophycin synthetase
MDYASTVATKVYAGPSLLSEHPVVSLAIPASLDRPIPASVVETLLGPTQVGSFTRRLSPQTGSLYCSEVTLSLTQEFLAAVGTPELGVSIIKDVEQQSVIVARFYDPDLSSRALLLSFYMARHLFENGENMIKSNHGTTDFVVQRIRELAMIAPDFHAQSIMRVAETKNIPYRISASASRVWLLGQGINSVQFFEAITSRNGLPGYSLSRNKAHTIKFIRSIGFPATRCAVANELAAGKEIAKKIGFPVVVKPVDGGKGQGVTANITQDAEFEMAFNRAMKTSTRAVLIENYVEGDDFRIFVTGGRFLWATNRIPAKVIGDGKQSVRELISKENSRRDQVRETQFDLKRIEIDQELVRVAAKQGYSLDDCPPENTTVMLSSIANISTGGTLKDSTANIHPDNVLMAERVARSFRLDTIGIDFITPDIGKSWRECDCAIIEVNFGPGFSTDEHARRILERKFEHGSDGRIPIILVQDCAASVHKLVVSELGKDREGVGYVSADTCELDGHARGDSLEGVSQKAGALLSDPACSALVIGLTTSDIEENGLPVDRCSVSLLSTINELPARIRQIVEVASETVVEIPEADDLNQRQLSDIVAKLDKS